MTYFKEHLLWWEVPLFFGGFIIVAAIAGPYILLRNIATFNFSNWRL